MKFNHALVLFIAAVAFSAGAMAVPPGQTVEFSGPMGKVVFDGKSHADAGQKCDDCHPKIFQMKIGWNKITMDAINHGEFCGTCHNGTMAFKANDRETCTNCHKK